MACIFYSGYERELGLSEISVHISFRLHQDFKIEYMVFIHSLENTLLCEREIYA